MKSKYRPRDHGHKDPPWWEQEFLELDAVDEWIERILAKDDAEPLPPPTPFNPNEPRKTCHVCERQKPISQFQTRANTPDHRSSRCRDCDILQGQAALKAEQRHKRKSINI